MITEIQQLESAISEDEERQEPMPSEELSHPNETISIQNENKNDERKDYNNARVEESNLPE